MHRKTFEAALEELNLELIKMEIKFLVYLPKELTRLLR